MHREPPHYYKCIIFHLIAYYHLLNPSMAGAHWVLSNLLRNSSHLLNEAYHIPGTVLTAFLGSIYCNSPMSSTTLFLLFREGSKSIRVTKQPT